MNRWVVGILLSVLCLNAWASTDFEKIHWGFLFMGLMGGLSLFLYGMQKLSDGLKRSAGKSMRSFLSSVTDKRLLGLGAGAFVTMVIQSSSATTVMLVSFVQAGLMQFSQTLAVILGADIGTTVTVQLIAFKLTDYSLWMIAVGFAVRTFCKQERWQHIGDSVFGCGVLFYGMKLMSDTMLPLRSCCLIIDFLKGMENPLLGILVGALITALLHSSAAFIGITIVLAQQNLISLESGIALTMGSNIGTCATAIIATFGMRREAIRVAIAHALFKMGGVLLFVTWIPQFSDFIRSGPVFLGGSIAREIANAHTIFNVVLAFVFLPFTGIFAKVVNWILPDREGALDEARDPNMFAFHLDPTFLKTPSLAINLARSEISRMAVILGRMLDAIIFPFTTNQPRRDVHHPELTLMEGVEMRERKIDFLVTQVEKYLIKLNQGQLTDSQSNEVFGMLSICKDIESIGDIIDKNVVPLVAKKRVLRMDFSPEGIEELKIFHLKVCKQISRVHEAFAELDPKVAQRSMQKMENYIDLESKYRIQHLERIFKAREESIETHEVHMELLDLLKQINVYTGNIAKTITKMAKTVGN